MGLLLALLVLGGLFWLLWHFRLRRVATRAEWRELAWAAGAIARFFWGMGLFSLAELARCRRLASGEALVRFDQLPERQADVVVAGRVSASQPLVEDPWVASVQSPLDGEGATWRETPTLAVELRADGTYRIASLGRDGRPDSRPGGPQADLAADIVLENGSLVQWPEGIPHE